MGKMEIFTVKATAKKLARRKLIAKIASIVTLISITILLGFYGTVSFASNLGNFTINVVDEPNIRTISLAMDKEFTDPRTVLVCDPIKSMDNITETMIDEDVDNIDGNHNGENYIAITFYLKNTGKVPINYERDIQILEATKGADEAIRIKLYKNGVAETYAKPKKGTQEPEENTTKFQSIDKVFTDERVNLLAGDIDKYTIVIWLEGNDPECIDNIKSGNVKMKMNFEII